MHTLRVRRGGTGEPTLLLLHGLGGTGDVWDGLIELLDERWPGSWVAPDLPGHGGSAALPRYSFGHLAAEVSHCVGHSGWLIVFGHSLGGVVALTLASGWFGTRVEAACGLGIKVNWSEEELARASALASRPNKTFPSRVEAAERYLKVTGLNGLLAADSAEVGAGLVEVEAGLVDRVGGWRLAMDPAAFGVGAPNMPGLLAAAQTKVVLAAGEHDPMCRADQLHALGAEKVILKGLGHNAHVENPDAVWPLLERLLASN